jgi:predicted O-linked N-acetylglucosamine transferase (SPINDLY family)
MTVPDGTSFDDALRLHRQGRLDEAERAYRQILGQQPEHAGALHLLGVVRQQRDDPETALELIGRAIAVNPGKAVYRNNYGAALLSLGRYGEALESFQRALAMRPNYPDALANLALVQAALGREDEAVANYRKALLLDPRHRDARRRLARLLAGSGRHQEVWEIFGKGPAERRSAEDLLDLGNVLLGAGRAAEAAEQFRELAAEEPDNAMAHFLLATACEAQYRIEDARRHFERAARLQPGKRLWQFRAAICAPAVYESGEEIDEYCAGVERRLEEWNSERPSPPAPLPSTGEGRHWPSPPAPSTREARHWPSPPAPLPEGEGSDRTPHAPREEIHHAERDEYGLADTGLNDIVEAGVFPGIAFSYQGRNNRRLKERFAAIYRDAFQNACRDAIPAPGSGLRQRRRIGFLVTRRHEGLFLRAMRGILKELDRNRFEPWILCSQESSKRIRAARLPDDVGVVPFNYALREAAARIREAACDLIYYWEVGSDAMNYFLPFARLAPVQCTGWGSTMTSGVPAVDWFLSSELVESRTPHAPRDEVQHAERDEYEEQYTERLWRSKTLFMCEPRLPPVAAASAADFGLPDGRRLYVCFQNPLKIHPDADALFAEILAADPRGLIVLSGRQPEVVRLIKERFARRIQSPSPPAPLPVGEGRPWPSPPAPLPSTGEGRQWPSPPAPLPAGEGRLVFLPPQPFENYCRLLQLADVVLDTPHYGAGSSCYDLFSYNLPVVTLPGDLIVGRITRACYRKMGVEDLVVYSPEEYVSKAVQVAMDRDYRRYVTERIAEASDVLFNDLEAVREHERFFEEALSHAK